MSNRQLPIGNRHYAGEVVGGVEIDVRAADFVRLEHAEWWRVDVDRDQILTTDVGIA